MKNKTIIEVAIVLDDLRSIDQSVSKNMLNKYKDAEWKLCRTVDSAIKYFDSAMCNVVFVSFDHDLGIIPENGEKEITGNDLFLYIEEMIFSEKLSVIPEMLVHSSNPSSGKIKLGIESLRKRVNNS